LPWSSVEICTDAGAVVVRGGEKVIPTARLLMLAMVPVKTIVASAVPSPVVNDSP
jgi:hypothetical protein